MARDFYKWLSSFKTSISGYDYYVDFEKVVSNVNDIKVELNILNSLIGNIEEHLICEKGIDIIPSKFSSVDQFLVFISRFKEFNDIGH